MSNVGHSPTLLPETPQITSHTSTEQWQSFEFRMRHRRAQRCLLRAEIALEAGFEDDAREALDEAERLHSDNPKLVELRNVLAERAAANAVAQEPALQASSSGRVIGVAAAALIFLLVGTGAYFLTRSNAPGAVSAPAAAPNARSEPAGSSARPPASVASAPAAAQPSQSTPAATAGQIEARPPQTGVDAELRFPRNAMADRSATAGDTRPTLPAFNPQFAEPRPVALPPPSPSVDPASLRAAAPPAPPEPAPVVPATPGAAVPVTLDRMGEKLAPTNLPALEPRGASERSASDKPAADPAPPPDEEPRVRAVLARYEAAYSGLDASAAQAVWPAVDERSLARAFGSLQSQQVSLGKCSVEVVGATANASCSGRITWSPKVGGGSQTAARQWRFELHSGNGTWQITRAEVR